MTAATHALLRWRRGVWRALRRWKGGATSVCDKPLSAMAKRIATGDLHRIAQLHPCAPWHEHACHARESARTILRRGDLFPEAASFLSLVYLEFLRATEPVYITLLEQERTFFLEATALDLVVCADARMHAAQWQKVDILLRAGGRAAKKPTTFPLMTDEQGTVLSTHSQVSQHMQDHFCEVEAGVQVRVDKIVHDYNSRPCSLSPAVERDIRYLPSPYDSERVLARVTPWRGAGPMRSRGTSDASRQEPWRDTSTRSFSKRPSSAASPWDSRMRALPTSIKGVATARAGKPNVASFWETLSLSATIALSSIWPWISSWAR